MRFEICGDVLRVQSDEGEMHFTAEDLCQMYRFAATWPGPDASKLPNGFFVVSKELLSHVFQLPAEIRIVAAQGVDADGTIRFYVHDPAVPEETTEIAQYLLSYEMVPRTSRLKHIERMRVEKV
jgi:hypothetical protein